MAPPREELGWIAEALRAEMARPGRRPFSPLSIGARAVEALAEGCAATGAGIGSRPKAALFGLVGPAEVIPELAVRYAELALAT
jgi:hypothetical protein